MNVRNETPHDDFKPAPPLAEKMEPFVQWLRRRLSRKPAPTVEDLRTQALYDAEVELLDAQLERDKAMYETTRLDGLIEALEVRIRRLRAPVEKP